MAVGAAAASPPGAAAGEFEDFAAAQQAYDSGEFRTAVTRFERLVGGEVPRLTNPVYVLESRKYLGASYVFVGRQTEAEHQFELLLQQEHDYALDPVAFPRPVIELFAQVRERLQTERRATEAAARAAGEAARRAEEQERQRAAARLRRLELLASRETVKTKNSRLMASIPFGVGQFQNGHDTLGYVLLAAEGSLAAASVVSFLIHVSLPRVPDRTTDEGDEFRSVVNAANALESVNQISTIAFVILAVAGVVDAHVRFVPGARETQERRLPEELRPTLRAGFDVSSVSVRF